MAGQFDGVASAVKEMVHGQQADQPDRGVRMTVTHLNPVTCELLESDGVVRFDDPDVEVTSTVRVYDAKYGIKKGDQLIGSEDDDGWVVHDVNGNQSEADPLGDAEHDAVSGVASDAVDGALGGSWEALTLTAGWTNLGSGLADAAAKKVAGVVYLRGTVIRSGAVGTTVSTLPIGKRPSHILCVVRGGTAGAGYYNLYNTGEIVIDAAPAVGQLIFLDGISFSLDA